MITNFDFQSDLNKKEILPVNFTEFPYVCNYVELDNRINKCIPWHWHPSLEMDYIADGELELQTTDDTYHLKKGDVFFVNSGVMHEIRAKNKMKGCRTYAHIFDMSFLSGIHNSLFEQKYLLPIIKSKELETFIIHPDTYQNIRIIEKFLKIIELNKQENFGYEFEIRTELCRIWCILFEETENLRAKTTKRNDVDMERMKIMMQYIHQHYMEKITLDHISAAASISNRECTRCFQRCIKLSPINYLNEHRIRIAAQMLLQTNDSITTISENCGFSSGSYFGKIFHETMGCTPKNYRKK